MNTTKIEQIARRILAENGVEGEPHPALLADTMNEVEYHADQFTDEGEQIVPEAPAPAPAAPAERPFKTYYVTGRDSHGDRRTVKTEARSVNEARHNASWILVTPGRVRRG